MDLKKFFKKLAPLAAACIVGAFGANFNVVDWIQFFGDGDEIERTTQLQDLRERKSNIRDQLYEIAQEFNEYLATPGITGLRVNEQYKIKRTLFNSLLSDFREIETQLAAFEGRSPDISNVNLIPPGQNPTLRVSGLNKSGFEPPLSRVEFEVTAGECFFHKETGFTIGVVDFPTRHTVQYYVAHTGGFSCHIDYGNLGACYTEVASGIRFLVAPQKIEFESKMVQMALVYDTSIDAENDRLYWPTLEWTPSSEIPLERF